MDIQLQNAYLEVLLENFLAVVKQNIMLQAQLEVNKKMIEETGESKRKLDELSNRNVDLQQKVVSLSNENNDLKKVVSKHSSDDNLRQERDNLRQEKNRLQSATNDYMRQLDDLKKQLLESKSESQDFIIKNIRTIDDLNKYINRLEYAIPANKLKKIKLNEPVIDESSVELIEKISVENSSVEFGGTF